MAKCFVPNIINQMRTALIIIYFAIAILIIVNISQWLQIKNLKTAASNVANAVINAATNSQAVKTASSTLGDMLNNLKESVKEVDLKF